LWILHEYINVLYIYDSWTCLQALCVELITIIVMYKRYYEIVHENANNDNVMFLKYNI
jgi:low temperature requirement protein LtrA